MTLLNFLPWRQQQRQRQTRVFFAQCIGIILVGGVGGLGLQHYWQAPLRIRQQHYQALQQQAQSNERTLQKNAPLQAQINALQQEQTFLQPFQTKRALRTLQRAMMIVPDALVLTDVEMTPATITLHGNSLSSEAIAQWLAQLQQQPETRTAQLDDVQQTQDANDYQFSLHWPNPVADDATQPESP